MISSFHVSILIALLVDLSYGVLVYATNPRRSANQNFLLLALVNGLWMVAVWQILNAQSGAAAELWIRRASIISLVVPTAFAFLRLGILYPDRSWADRIRALRFLLLINAVLALMCLTRFFMRGAFLPPEVNGQPAIAESNYGPGFVVFNIYYLTALAWLAILFVRDARRTLGIQRTEIQFVLLGYGACIATGISFALIIPALSGTSRTAPLAPMSVILLNGILAYGIATKRILGVALILRRATAYGLLTTYLVALYFSVAWLAARLGHQWVADMGQWPQLLAALAVAFSVAPAHGRLQRLANRLFINVQTVDVGSMVRRVTQALQSISTVDDMIAHFHEVVSGTLGADRVAVLMSDGDAFVQMHAGPAEVPARLALTAPLVLAIQTHRRPLVVDTLRRRPLSPQLVDAVADLTRLGAAVGIGIHFKDNLSGLVLLGPRLSGRIYGAPEEDALQIICDELAVALENARLFTETRNSRIYNDILLDNLGTGMVAMDQQETITVINRDAQRLLRLTAEQTVGKKCEVLPNPLGTLLRETMVTGLRHGDEEVLITFAPDDRLYVRVGGSVFRSHTGQLLGALVVFHDVSHLKKLQSQVRRSDRLASMGTLSAGMAHEIKNPLVTIKTFTQLLPERYEDPEFRESFVTLVSGEVKRIDTLVNQLLTFARPSKPSLTPLHMHQVVDDSLRLVQQQLERHNIAVARDYRCTDDLFLGDADLLSQAFVNFFLNAQDAMPGGGTLKVATSLVQNSRTPRPRAEPRPAGGSALLLRIEDTGIGIRDEDLVHIFDPFFTTKSHGTGLGLAVAHGIIDEQGGGIDVQSQVGAGTAFLINFPHHPREPAA